MTTKKFSQMTTKKLNALLATASEEDKVEIMNVLNAREQVQTPEHVAAQAVEAAETAEPKVAEIEPDGELSPEEQAAIEAAEKNNGVNPMFNTSKSATEKKPKMTDVDRAALAESLRVNVGHRCQVVPFNTAEWINGTIAGVIEEKRTNKVLYAIKTDDGRRIVKVHDSNLIKILDEVVEIERRARTSKPKNNMPQVEWTNDVVAEEVGKISGNVGKMVTFKKYSTVDESGNEHVEVTTGRIVSIVPDKRVKSLLYRIAVPTPTEEDPTATKTVHKVSTADLNIAEEFDEIGAEINSKFLARRIAASEKALATPQDRIVACEEALKKAEEKLKKAQEEYETKLKQLQAAKAELEAFLKAQQDCVPVMAGSTQEVQEAQASESDPLA